MTIRSPYLMVVRVLVVALGVAAQVWQSSSVSVIAGKLFRYHR
ncbi:hypothetical protein ACT691_01185 [Vibrio metschnikovii]